MKHIWARTEKIPVNAPSRQNRSHYEKYYEYRCKNCHSLLTVCVPPTEKIEAKHWKKIYGRCEDEIVKAVLRS